jgi:hypothetical protein
MSRKDQLGQIFIVGAITLGIFMAWFSGNFFYSLFWAWLGKWNFKEADVIAYTLAHLTPFVLTLAAAGALYIFVRHEMKRNAGLQPIGEPVRDVSLYDAVCRMYLGRWERISTNEGHLALDRDGFQAIHDLLEHIRQLAFENRLPIWGKRSGYQTLWENPGNDFWRHNQIEYISFTDADPVRLRAVPINTSGQVVSLRELMTNRGAVDALPISQFNNRGIWAKLRPLFVGAWSKVDPSYIIVAGLIVAAAGVAWQLSRVKTPLSETDIAKITAPFQTQIDILKKQLDKPFWSSGATPTPPTPLTSATKRYTAYEKEQRLRAVDEIYGVLATQLQPTYSEGKKLLYEIYQVKADDRAEQRLADYVNNVQTAFDNLNGLLKKYSYFTDIVQGTTKNTFNDVAATHGARNLIGELQALRSKVPNDIQWFLLRDTTMIDALNQIRDFEQYLSETTKRLQEKRGEIEKAEVYSAQ